MQELLNKYGGEKHMSLPEHIKVASKVQQSDEARLLAKTSAGGAQGGLDTELTGLTGIKSKYNEDVLIGSHTAVWGSFFCTQTKKWGFKCCKSTDKRQAKCITAEAKKAPLLKAVGAQ